MRKYSVILYSKHLVVLIIFGMMMLQSVSPTLALLVDTSYELELVDREEDVDEKEKREDIKEKKIKLFAIYTNNTLYYRSQSSLYSKPQSIGNSIVLEIPIPPPDIV
ncbi:hypothetical protein [Dokdonia sp.]|uniref:hypothetical protein n=1 Tax=Dokdonia sp. TaxID=2024995 RepID=UPI003263F748